MGGLALCDISPTGEPTARRYVGRTHGLIGVLLFLLQTIIPTAFSSQMVVPTVNRQPSTPPWIHPPKCPFNVGSMGTEML
jgi:hypothetical protein